MRIIKTFGLAVLCLFVLLNFAGSALAEPQTTCPVMGGKINKEKEIYADYQGQRVYFCCEACREPFTKDPEKYLAKMQKMGQEPEVIGEGSAAAEESGPTDDNGHTGHEGHN